MDVEIDIQLMRREQSNELRPTGFVIGHVCVIHHDLPCQPLYRATCPFRVCRDETEAACRSIGMLP